MTRKSDYASTSIIVGFVMTICMFSSTTMGQAVPTQKRPSSSKPAQSKPNPVSLPHLYWHFLVYQNHLDAKATELTAQGKDGSILRDFLQKKSGLSDADFVSVRTSSARLSTKMKYLDTQAAAVQTSGSLLSHDQLKALTDQRESAINFEIVYLKQNLSPDKIKAFEAFLTQLFSPTNASTPPSPFATRNPVPLAVQK
jgi:hypothetical protein